MRQSNLVKVDREVCAIWTAVDHHKETELLVKVYDNFLRDIYSKVEIYFFVQSHRIIDRVMNGDLDITVEGTGIGSLADAYIPVERVVDITEEIFKTSSALSIFENTQVVELEYSRL